MIEEINIAYEKIVLVGIITQNQSDEKSKEYLDELQFLAYTAGGGCWDSFGICFRRVLSPVVIHILYR